MRCGTAFTPSCSHCGTELPAGAAFCFACGRPVTAAAPIPAARFASPESYTPKHLADKILTTRSAVEGERKQVTVLFADVSGFTALSERLDPEEVHRLMARAFDLILAEVHRYEGTVNQFLGDGIRHSSGLRSPTRIMPSGRCTPRLALAPPSRATRKSSNRAGSLSGSGRA
jgi:class 3 adenylate cyclase